MPLSPGDRIGPYQIAERIGAGGMGEVYRAADTRMGRDVALKVSAERFSDRFSREVHAVAALNHPNVCILHDVGENYLVMELIEGPTLAERIAHGPIPLEEALGIAKQMAAALEAAHDKGIVHRDLKPGNIKIKPDGTVKVLDFGLAKVVEAAAATTSEASPTISMAATQAGIILGTAAYMSPEQARGRPVDKRADIWAFGVVLYEMVTGKGLFQGEDLADLLAAVLKVDPDLSAAPPELRRLLKKCLEKDPKNRLRDIGDVWELLDREPGSAPPVPASPPYRWLWPAVAAVLLVAAGFGWLRHASIATPGPTIAFSIAPAPDWVLPPVGSLTAAPLISPDGGSVLFRQGGVRSAGLYVRRLDSLSAAPVPGAERAFGQACWAPDSASVIYPAQSGLMRVRMPDGAPEAMTPKVGTTRGCSVNADGAVLLAMDDQLFFLPATRGEFQKLALPGLGKPMHPEFLPNGRDFLFSVPASGVYLASLEGGKIANLGRLMENDHQAGYTPAGGGSILFVRGDNLYAQSLDLRGRKLAGKSRLIQEGIGSIANQSDNSADFSVSRSGAIAWRPGRAASSQVTAVDRTGKVIGTTGPSSGAFNLSLSPDGTQLLAYGEASTLLLRAGQPGSQALDGHWFGWSADGSEIFGVDDERVKKRSLTRPEAVVWGSLPLEMLGEPRDISPDGTQLLYAGGIQGEGGLLALPLGGSAQNLKPALLAPAGATAIMHARFSPDGHWIVYSQDGLYVQPFPGPGLRRQIGPDGTPFWRGDGREIIERARDGFTSITVSWAQGEPQFGTPTVLFSPKGVPPAAGSVASAISWVVSRDGSRIYWLRGEEQPGWPPGVIDVRTNAVK